MRGGGEGGGGGGGVFFFFQAEDGIRDYKVTGVQTCALPIYCNAYYSNQGAVRECISDSVMNVNSAKQGHREHDHLKKKERAQLKKAWRAGKYECTYNYFKYFHTFMYEVTFAFNNIFYNTSD